MAWEEEWAVDGSGEEERPLVVRNWFAELEEEREGALPRDEPRER